jgi:hypothetical protein
MALCLYLHIASKRSVLPQNAGIVYLNASQRKLIDISSQCIVSAVQCAELSAQINAPLFSNACKGCQDSGDYAIMSESPT